ncbi:MAG: barstar family protein [Jatrophihabitantaceae bacterium]
MSAGSDASSRDGVIRAIYAQVSAPDWAAPNLDALADVLRDLSWLPQGPVTIEVPDLTGLDRANRRLLRAVLARAVGESAASPRPVQTREHDERH